MLRSVPLVAGETFHIYNRGAHKEKIFTCPADYNRFLLLLYICNSSEKIHLSNILSSKKYQGESLINIFTQKKVANELVDVFAYSLMPNHFHLIVRPKSDNGLAVFMKKALTAYAMYFNIKYEHSGVLFQGPFKSKHIDSEEYFRYIFAYLHLNPLELSFPSWKENGVTDLRKAREAVSSYEYSSFWDYSVGMRPERSILAYENAPDFLKTQNDLEELLQSFQQGESLLK